MISINCARRMGRDICYGPMWVFYLLCVTKEELKHSEIHFCPPLNLPLREWTMTNWTGEWLFSGMDTAMGSQIGSLREMFSTDLQDLILLAIGIFLS